MVLNPFSKKKRALRTLKVEYEFFLDMYRISEEIIELVKSKNAKVVDRMEQLAGRLNEIKNQEKFNVRVSKLKRAVDKLLALPSVSVSEGQKAQINNTFQDMSSLERRAWDRTQQLFQSVSGLSKNQRWDIPLEHANKLKVYLSGLVVLDRKLKEVIDGYS